MTAFARRRLSVRASRRHLPACLLPWFLAILPSCATVQAHAQTSSSSTPVRTPEQTSPLATASDDPASEVPDVPGLPALLHGLNGGISFSGVHDAQNGWAVVSTPAIGYSFNEVFSIDASIPIYNFRLAETLDPRPGPDALLVPLRAELGDVVTALHIQLLPPHLEYQITFSATAPTGDYVYGLSSGSPTFDLSNQLSHDFKRVTPAVELGVGDSSTLANALVVHNYTSLGPLAHFQLGLAFPLLWGSSFEANAYENLPLGDQKIYESVRRRRMNVTEVLGRGVAEDNGFTASLDIPLDDHVTLSGYYNHSLRLHDDTASFSISYVLRSAGEKSTEKDARAAAAQDDIIARSLGPRSDALGAGTRSESPANHAIIW